ncbi:MAG: hypothetical protein ACK5LT_09580 [Lachnospirales bacterium]
MSEKLTKLSLGEIKGNGVGVYKKKLIDNIENIELLLAHMVPE